MTGWNNELSLETKPIYDANVLTLQAAFTEANACTDNGSYYSCSASGVTAIAYDTGRVSANDGSFDCRVREFNDAYCYG